MKVATVCAAILLLGLLVACATKSPPHSQSSAKADALTDQGLLASTQPATSMVGAGTGDSVAPAQGDASAPLSIVRYVGWDVRKWVPENPGEPKTDNQLAGLYTRLEVYSEQEVGGTPSSAKDSEAGAANIPLRAYDKENRGWFERLFESETDTVTTLANVEIKDPGLKIAIPLFSISHASGRDLGNTWVTNFTQSYVESPLFLIGPDTAVVVHLKAEASAELKSQAAASIIGAVTQAVQIAAPASTLLTKLSKPEINNTATAIDTTISNLFSKDQTEDVELGRFADTWTKESKFIVKGCAPFVRFDGAFDDTMKCSERQSSLDAKIGSWKFGMRCPQVSVFSASKLCSPSKSNIDDLKFTISKSISDSDILKYPLSSQITIGAFLKSQSWYTNFINKSNKSSDDYGNFCVSLMTGEAGLPASGLSYFDSALALRAIVHTLSISADITSGFVRSSVCKAQLSQQSTFITLAAASS